MKKLATIICLAMAITFTSFAKPVKLSFKVKNFKSKTITINIIENYITKDRTTYNCEIDSLGNGFVSFKLDRPKEVFFSLPHTNFFLFLSPGDNMTISYDHTNPVQTINFSGIGSDNCNFIKEYRLRFHDGYNGSELLKNGLSNDDYKNEINKRWEARKNFYSLYTQSHQITPEFKYYAQALVDYSSIKEHLMLNAYRIKKQQEFPNKQQFYSFISPDYFENDSVLKYAQGYLSTASFFWAIKEVPQQKDSTLSDDYQRFFSCYKGKTRDYFLAQYLNTMYGDYKEFNNDYKHFKTHCGSPEVLEILDKKFSVYTNPTIPKEVKNTILVDPSGKETTLGSLLKKHKGTVLYLDIWGTGCPPCIQEMKHMPALEEKLKDHPFSIISISVDRSDSQWSNTLNHLKLSTNNQYRLKESLSSYFCKNYAISSIPRFFIIDKNSSLYSANAERPSDESLVDTIIKCEKL